MFHYSVTSKNTINFHLLECNFKECIFLGLRTFRFSSFGRGGDGCSLLRLESLDEAQGNVVRVVGHSPLLDVLIKTAPEPRR